MPKALLDTLTASLVPRPLPPEEWPGTHCLRMRVILRYILRKKHRELTHADWYAEYYTNQEYGLLFWRNERFNLQNLSLSSRNKAFYRFAYSKKLDPRMAYSNRRARTRARLPNHIYRSCDRRLAT